MQGNLTECLIGRLNHVSTESTHQGLWNQPCT